MLQQSMIYVISGTACNFMASATPSATLSSYLQSQSLSLVFTHNSQGILTSSSTDNVSTRRS